MKIIYTAAIISTVFILCGCQAISNWADGVGQHMPVIGERCENWQCFTASGQRASREKIKQQQAVPAVVLTVRQPPYPSPAENARQSAKIF